MKKSRVYKLGNRYFRYDFDRSVVELVSKAGKEEIAEDAEWMDKYGKPLWDIDESGFMVLDAVGLRPENWKNKAVRDEYLSEWAAEKDEEYAIEAEMFVKYELPHYV